MRKKKKTIATAAAVALAAALVFGGGTLAYFSWTSDEVDNIAANNYNWVSLTETGVNENGEKTTIGGSDATSTVTNDTYEIIPGTSQDKDPLVTASYSLDSYVFVEVTDTSGGLISWDYDLDNWTELTSTKDDAGNITYAVYYKLLETSKASAAETNKTSGGYTYYLTELNVLDGKSISYDSSITNDDNGVTVNEKGEVTEVTAASYSLTFQAHIVQAYMDTTEDNDGEKVKVLANPADAYAVALGAPYVADASYEFLEADKDTTIAQALASAVTKANESTGTTVIVLPEADEGSEAVELNSTLEITADVVIDLSGNTLSYDGRALNITDTDADVTLTSGTITGNATPTNPLIYVKGNSLQLEVVDVTASTGVAIYAAEGTVTIDEESVVSVTSTEQNNTYASVNVYPVSEEKVTLNVYGTVSNTSNYMAISGNGTCNWDGATEINIYEGASVESNGLAIYHPQNGTLNIYGGSISGYAGIAVSNGTVNVFGGKIQGTENDHQLNDSYSGSNGANLHIDGSGIVLANAYGNISMNISGGTISSSYSYAIRGYQRQEYTYTSTVNISGGTLSGALGADNTTAYVYIPSGYNDYFIITDTRS